MSGYFTAGFLASLVQTEPSYILNMALGLITGCIYPNPDELEPNRDTSSSFKGEIRKITPGPLGRKIFVILYKILRLRD